MAFSPASKVLPSLMSNAVVPWLFASATMMVAAPLPNVREEASTSLFA